MAATRLSDVITQPILASYQAEDPIYKTAIFESGILETNGIINQLAAGASNLINIPFWTAIDSSVEPNYSNDNPADIAVPRSITSAEQTARIAYLNEGFSAAMLVKELTNQDPTAEVAKRLDRYWRENVQRRLVATLAGLYNDNVADNGGDMVVDVSDTVGTPTAANMFSYDSFIDADATFGDALTETGAIMVHRKVYTAMQKSKEIDFIPSPDTNMNVPYYAGKRVIVDNSVPVIGTGANAQYVSIIFGAGAIGYGMSQPSNGTTMAYVDEQANGGGVETIWTRRNIILHPAGYKFTSTTITGNGTETPPMSASWGDLALATNWERVFDRKNVPIAFLVTNG